MFRAEILNIVLAAPFAFAASCSKAERSNDFVCHETSNYEVQIGQHRFSIPRGLEPNIFPADQSKQRFSEQDLCQSNESHALQADRVSFLFEDNAIVSVPDELAAITNQISPVQLIIEKRPAVDRPVSLGFLLEDLEEEGLNYESLVFEGDLYCFQPTEADLLMCITSSEFLSPLGNPIAYVCGEETSVSRGGKLINIGRLCIGNYFLSSDLMLTVRIYDKWQPKAKWRSHDASIREFLSLIESSIP